MTNTQESVDPQQVKPKQVEPVGGGYFSDDELLYALVTWLFTTADLRSGCIRSTKSVRPKKRIPLTPLEILAMDTTVAQVRESDIRLRLALLTQPEDLTRLIGTFSESAFDAYPLMKAAWG